MNGILSTSKLARTKNPGINTIFPTLGKWSDTSTPVLRKLFLANSYNAYKQGKLVKLPFLGSIYLDLKQ